ncbi:MAG: YafY family protein [Mycobacteriales bacterium]
MSPAAAKRPAAKPPGGGAASGRLARLLSLIPYLVAHPGVAVSEVASVFEIDEEQLRADLDLLFVCGLPGYAPGDLIDVSYEGDRITVSNADEFSRPLRLSPDEALALVVAARSLAAVPGLSEGEALTRAIAKLEAALGPEVDPAAKRVTVLLDPEGETLRRLRAALAEARRVHLRYHSAGRDEVTERDVDPMRVLSVEGRWYLEGWCRRVEDVRLFRLDRILSADVLDLPAQVPVGVQPRDLSEGLYRPEPGDQAVVLDVTGRAVWISDYFPCDEVSDLPGGGRRVTLRARDLHWLRRLILQMGSDVRVVEPASLREDVQAAALAALTAYDEAAD